MRWLTAWATAKLDTNGSKPKLPGVRERFPYLFLCHVCYLEVLSKTQLGLVPKQKLDFV